MIKIYTRLYCSYCVRAKRLLQDLGHAFSEIPVDRDASALQEMKQLSGAHTVPQIWAGETHIGGCDELVALHSSGQLAGVVAQSQ